MVAGTIDRSPFVLTGSSDQRIRYWDLGAIERSTSRIGDTQIRYQSAPKNCSLVVPGARENISESGYTYELANLFIFCILCKLCHFLFSSRLIDGTAVLYEVANNASAAAQNTTGGGSSASRGLAIGTEEQQPRSGPEMPASGHNDGITDMLISRTASQTFIASASRDGVVKLWK